MRRAFGVLAVAGCLAVVGCLAVLLALAARHAGAHTRSVSYSSWEIEDAEARVLLRIPQLELTRLPWGVVYPPSLPPGLARYVTDSLLLTAAGEPCWPTGPVRALIAPEDRAVLEWRVRCASARDLSIETRLLLDVAPSHLHFARLRGQTTAAMERVLSSAEPRWDLSPPDEPAAGPLGSPLLTYLTLGIEHILTGYDHLVFLMALLLLAARLAEVATIVTGFTLAHSFTLALAALGQLRPEAAAIEALIGLSIALVATENAWILGGRPRRVPVAMALALAGAAVWGAGAVPAVTWAGLAVFALCYFELERRVARPMRLRFGVAFCFGLVHGFGFAGVLAEIGLPQDRLLPALLGFNLGVELGQLALVLLLWPGLRWLARPDRERLQRRVVELTTAAICGVGLFWLIERAYG